MNKLDKDYQALLQDILDNGHQKGDRTGTGTISVFGRQIRHNMKDGFPLVTTKKMYTKGIIAELLWFLRGETNIKSLIDVDCNIWNGDAYKKYLKWAGNEPLDMEQFIKRIKTDSDFAGVYGELGPVYGKQWRGWGRNATRDEKIVDPGVYIRQIDQIANAINDLKTNPDSRRIIVSAWNVAEIDQMTLPPCHNFFQFYTRELSDKERIEWMGGKIQEKYPALVEQQIKHCDEHNVPKRAISLMWNQRSVDTFLGLPFNMASYGLLLEIIAKDVNMIPDELIGNLGDTHLYLNHIDQALEQIGRELRVDERVCMCYENPELDLSKIQEGMSDSEFTKVCDEFNIPTRTRVPYMLPTLVINDEFWNPDAGVIEQIEHIKIHDFDIRNYQSHPTIKAPLSN
jgi:thymidylate synthase